MRIETIDMTEEDFKRCQLTLSYWGNWIYLEQDEVALNVGYIMSMYLDKSSLIILTADEDRFYVDFGSAHSAEQGLMDLLKWIKDYDGTINVQIGRGEEI